MNTNHPLSIFTGAELSHATTPLAKQTVKVIEKLIECQQEFSKLPRTEALELVRTHLGMAHSGIVVYFHSVNIPPPIPVPMKPLDSVSDSCSPNT